MNRFALVLMSTVLLVPIANATDMYAGMKIGKSRHYLEGIGNTPTGIGIFGGYTVSPSVAIEVEYIDLGNFGGNKVTARDASALFFYPGGEAFSLYLKISYASTVWKVIDDKQRNSSFTHGLGMQYNPDDKVSYRFTLDRYMIGNQTVQNIDLLNVSGIYRF